MNCTFGQIGQIVSVGSRRSLTEFVATGTRLRSRTRVVIATFCADNAYVLRAEKTSGVGRES